MKKVLVSILVLVVLMGISGISGCGVVMNSTYSNLLDKTVEISGETSQRAQEDKLSISEMKESLRLQYETWLKFQMARDGKK